MRWEIRDPIHGYILVNEFEKKILDSRPMQRLRNIKQLAGAHLTYPGAEHSRFGHSLGTMHLAEIMVNVLVDNEWLERDEAQLIEIAALLHDVGHGPFSHVFEEVLEEKRKITHEEIAEKIILNSEISEMLEEEGYNPKSVSNLIVGRNSKFTGQIIRSQIDVDKMDYLIRDSYFTGVEYGMVDVKRLIYSTKVSDESLVLDRTALYALETFLIARYEMFKAVYYHKTVRSAEIMLAKAMIYADDELNFTQVENIEEFLMLDDATAICMLRNLKANDDNTKMASKLIRLYDARRLLKPAYEREVHLADPVAASLLAKPSIRRKIEEEISEEAGISPSEVFLDVPTLPSLPYNPRQIDVMEVFVYDEYENRKVPLTQISELASVLKSYYDVIRTYTFPEHREKVRKASERVLHESSLSMRVAY